MERWTAGKILTSTVTVLFIAAMALFAVYPVVYALLGSLKTNMELTLGGTFLPAKPMFQNYIDAFQKAKFILYSINSVVLSVMTTVLALITSSLAGYVVARHQFVGKKLLMSLYLGLMFVSLGAVSLYPQYILMYQLGLTGNLLGLAIVLTGGQAANVFLIMGFTKSIPKELDESAFMDGCSPFQIYRTILLPLIKPILAVVALFTFRSTWNDYITSLIFTMSRPELKPLTVAVVSLRYSTNAAAELNIMTAGASIALLPILIVYLLANKQFISGLTAGAIKG
ncbi:carbohydrate ABC transporter permease [Paenibacillus thalictri]|uniref:Carbohydrate ABC transporter permease n=1 Tax=Paenibacillus thalictri TaxID=2527873 RepID=A0A4Q9DUE7_9BACL|nr:carbohydrate ABC transporter permease [Paenibacillus thalictri]TBL80569.1 carbohydrate ABC transporter permease [Paenibacillus thalictri]